jgi:hypothetical protein
MKNWADVYNHHKSKGMDQNDAAYRADEWEKRQLRKVRSKAASSKQPNFCESCAMDLATCDCVNPRPATVFRSP